MLRSIQLAFATAVLALVAAPAVRAQDAAGPVHVFRYIDVAPQARLIVPRMLKTLSDASAREQGVVRFEVLQRTAPTNQFLTVEQWKDQAAFDAHMAAAHTKRFLDQINRLLIAPIDTRMCHVLDVSPAPEGRLLRSLRRYAVTHVDVNPPGKDQALAALKTLAAASRKHTGNVRFDVLGQNVRNANHFQVVEVWRTQRADDAHEVAPDTKAFREKLAPLLGALYDERWYRPL
jgi:quinol monooxygenase YgiN